MKIKNIVFFLLLIVIIAMIVLGVHYKKEKPVKTDMENTVVSTIPTVGKYCFARIQSATADAPYNVEEHVVLNFNGVKVTGTKRGTQNGPDMTNGYEGTLSGATIENEIELTYAYTVEGSKNRELEVYTVADGKLIKKRWVLQEQKINGQSILVPDYKGDPTLISYTKEECAK